jgi:hypothetical protein
LGVYINENELSKALSSFKKVILFVISDDRGFSKQTKN